MSTLPDYRFMMPAPLGSSLLRRFIVLSLLLHIMLVMLFGDTGNSGGATRSERLWGAFRATLAPAASGPGLKLDRKVDIGNLAARPPEDPPSAQSPRPAVEAVTPASMPSATIRETREGAMAAPPQPGAAATTEVLPYIAKEVDKPTSSFVVAPPSSTPPVVAPAAERPRLLPLQNIDAVATPSPARELAPFVAPKPPEEAPVLPRLVPLPAATIGREAAPPTLMPRILPELPTPALAPMTPARIERETVAPIEPPSRALPPAPLPLTVPAPLAPVKVESESAAAGQPLPLLLPVPAATSTPSELRSYVPPAPTRPATLPRELPAANEAPTTAPPAATPTEVPLRPPARIDTDTLPRQPAEALTVTPPSPASSAGPAISADNPALSRDAPSAGAPRLDLDAMRNRARDMGSARASEGSGPRTVLPFPTPSPEVLKSKEARIFDKALKRPDCRDAYAGFGLAAVVPLVADAISNKGCKW